MEQGENTNQDVHKLAQQSVKRKQRERKLRKERKKAKRIKSLWRFLILLLLVFGMYKFVELPQWYLAQDSFTTGQNIEVLNNEIVPDKVIYDAVKKISVPNVPIFMMSVNPVKQEIFKIPLIKQIFVRRYGFPARIQIIVRERVPSVVFLTDLNVKPKAFITTDGVLITNKNYMTLKDLPLKILIKNGIDISNEFNPKRIEQIKKIVKEVEAYSSETVEYVDVRNQNDVYVKIETTNIRLGVLDSTVFERIKRIRTILPEIDKLGEQVKYVDLSWDKVNYLKLNSEDKKIRSQEDKPDNN